MHQRLARIATEIHADGIIDRRDAASAISSHGQRLLEPNTEENRIAPWAAGCGAGAGATGGGVGGGGGGGARARRGRAGGRGVCPAGRGGEGWAPPGGGTRHARTPPPLAAGRRPRSPRRRPL